MPAVEAVAARGSGDPAADPARRAPGRVRTRPPRSAAERRAVADTTIRVDVDLLDALMRLVGELVLTRNQIVARPAPGRPTST